MSPGRRIYFFSAICIAIFALLFSTQYFKDLIGSGTPHVKEEPYQVQIFAHDPLILYFRSFLSKDEINHLLHLSEGRFEVSRVWRESEGYVDLDVRVSETAPIERDEVVHRIEQRAMNIIGWRDEHTKLQRLKVQRYHINGYYNFHYDWDPASTEGNRMTTFMVYLVDNCTGGGTNFPRLKRPMDQRWCDVIECEDNDDYPGVIFTPIAGSAVYWENFHPNGTPHRETRHAGLPVESGNKVGLNIWSWDNSWRPQDMGL